MIDESIDIKKVSDLWFNSQYNLSYLIQTNAIIQLEKQVDMG